MGNLRLTVFPIRELVFREVPPDEPRIATYRAKFEAKILAAFDAVKSAPAIIWDIRGNGGGLTLVGLGIALDEDVQLWRSAPGCAPDNPLDGRGTV